MADWYGCAFRLELSSAECFSDKAILRGSFQVKTPSSKSSALLRLVTSPDHFLRLIDIVDHHCLLVAALNFIN